MLLSELIHQSALDSVTAKREKSEVEVPRKQVIVGFLSGRVKLASLPGGQDRDVTCR